MKAAKSNRSLASFKSSKSMRTALDGKKGDVGGEFLDLAIILPTACAKLQCPYAVTVKKIQQNDEYYKSIKYGDPTPRQRKKLSIMPSTNIAYQVSDVKTSDDSKSLETEQSEEANTLVISALYDTYNCLTQILLSEIKVPRTLVQVIGLLAPYFQNLTTLTVQRCRIDFYILHEISKILDISTMTSICIDNCPVLERNYDVLLTEQSSLRHISLCKCKLDDDDCKLLVAKLHHGGAAENFQTLNLSSNHITDVGAKYVSDALRSNRRLRYLNLADNRITDLGAGYLLDVLIEFPLTNDEIHNMRLRYMKYLKYRQVLYSKYLNECDRSYDDLSQISRKSAGKKKKSARKDRDSEDVRERAEMLAKEILGQFTDPFEPNSLKHRDECCYCIGNMVLCYLNLSYNNLSFLIVKKLQNVVMYQNATKKSIQSGLLKVVLDGNNLPMCREMVLLNELFGRNIRNIAGKTELVKRRRSRI